MVAITADKVVVELEAKLGQYNANVKGAERQWQSSMNNIRREGSRTETSVSSLMSGISKSAKIGLGAFGAGYLAKEVGDLSDKFIRFENRLKTAGIEGERLTTVADKLFETANRNGVEFEALGSVYARASLSSKDLGASQEQLDTFVNAVSNGLRIQGASAESARGALLQLSQSLGQDIVRGEEFNSILENALPLAQAAARGIDRFKGSVSDLRTAIINGEVTSREFFNGILKDAPNLALQASKANLTLENSFTALYNQLARGIGTTNNSLGVTERLSGGILYLADNLDTLGDALVVITAAVGSRYVSALVTAGASQAKFYAGVASGNAVIIGGARASEQKALADKAAAAAALEYARAERVRAAATVQAVQADIAAQKARVSGMVGVNSSTPAGAEVQSRIMKRQIELSRDLAAANRVLAASNAAEAAAAATATAAETAHTAALVRTTIAARAATVAQSAYMALSGFVGGPLGIALTGLAATYLIVSSRTAAAEQRTKALEEELRSLGYLAPDVANSMDGAAKSIDSLAKDEIITKLKTLREELDRLAGDGGITRSLASMFGMDTEVGIANIVSEARDLTRQFADMSSAVPTAAIAIIRLSNDLKNGAVDANEFNSRLAAIDVPNEQIASLIGSLRTLGATYIATGRAITDFESRAGMVGVRDPRSASMASRATNRKNLSATNDFISERDRVASLTEEQRAIEKRAEALMKEAKASKIVLNEQMALAQARKEIARESEARTSVSPTGNDGISDAARNAEADAKIIADLVEQIKNFGNARQGAIDSALGSLSKSATAETRAEVEKLTGALFDLALQAKTAELSQDNAGLEKIIAAYNENAEAVKRVTAEIELENEARQNNIDLDSEEGRVWAERKRRNIELTQTIDDLKAKEEQTKNFTRDLGQALNSAFENAVLSGGSLSDIFQGLLQDIARLILRAYVLSSVMQTIGIGSNGLITGGGIIGGVGSLLGFASGTPNTGGARGEPRGIVHGQEAVIPLPSGGRVPVELRLPPALKAGGGGGGGGTSIQIINNTSSKVETQTSRDSNGREIVQFMISEVKKEFANGGFDKAQSGRYGVKPTGVRR